MFKVICAPRRLSLGNLYEESFADIWNGERFHSLRMKVMTGAADPVWDGICETCPY